MNRKQKQTDALIRKYFEGQTSSSEEKRLRDYFRTAQHTPPEWDAAKAMFGYVSEEIAVRRPKPVRRRITTGRTVKFGIAVAASLLALFMLRFYQDNSALPEVSQAYIDGKRDTGIEALRSGTLRALSNLSDGDESLYAPQVEALDAFFE
ncbi:MAG: hypothetical protein LBD27_01365 [Tannerella sp.]|jgi:hypothetical protein|nr:hypothetical protein [Tannerella sp.]